MKLRFLGEQYPVVLRQGLRSLRQTYSAANHQVETVASDCTARFLGQNYTLRRPIQTFKSQLGVRKYRGVVYGAE